MLLQASPACTCRHSKAAVTPAAAPEASAAAPEASAAAATEGRDPSQTAAAAAAQTPDAEAEAKAAAAADAVAQVSKQDRIAAAREKFLARKRQKTGG